MFISILQAKGGGQKLRTDEPCELVSAYLQSRVALEAQKRQKKSSVSIHTRAYSGNKHYPT